MFRTAKGNLPSALTRIGEDHAAQSGDATL